MEEIKDRALSSVTSFLDKVLPLDSHSTEVLLPQVYRELRQLANSRLRRETPGQTLQTTALVHEAYLRLVGTGAEPVNWKSRAHFFAAASEAMRRIVIESCRRKSRLKRGGGLARLEVEIDSIGCKPAPYDLLDINAALLALEGVDPRKALLVKLRYFAGMTIPEAAQVLEISTATAERLWRYSRAWLADYLSDGGDD